MSQYALSSVSTWLLCVQRVEKNEHLLAFDLLLDLGDHVRGRWSYR